MMQYESAVRRLEGAMPVDEFEEILEEAPQKDQKSLNSSRPLSKLLHGARVCVSYVRVSCQ